MIGKLIGRQFVAAFEQVGGFLVSRSRHDASLEKQGGNVVTYFCTPDREVIHFLVGPVTPEILRTAAHWSLHAISGVDREAAANRAKTMAALHRQQIPDDLLKTIASETLPAFESLKRVEKKLEQRRACYTKMRRNQYYLASSQVEKLIRMSRVFTSPAVGHFVLFKMPLSPLTEIERPVFESLANEIFESRGELTDEFPEKVRARRKPVLIVVSDRAVSQSPDKVSPPEEEERLLKDMVQRIDVLKMTGREFIRLMDDLNQPPPEGEIPRYVVFNRSWERVATLSTKTPATELMLTVRQAIENSPPKTDTPEERREKSARDQLDLAKSLWETNPAASRRRLQHIVENTPATQAAATARKMLLLIE